MRACLVGTFALLVACTAPRALSVNDAKAQARIAELNRTRDFAALTDIERSSESRLEGSPPLRAALGRALYWTGGIHAARAQLQHVCNDVRLPAEGKTRMDACAVLAFAELAKGRMLHHVMSFGEAPLLKGQKLFIAMVSVNGHKPEPFILDTGAPTTVISKRYAERVQIPHRTDVYENASDGGGNPVKLFPSLLGSVKLGTIDVHNVPVHVLELPENFKIGGILSPQDVFRGTAFELNGRTMSLRIYPPQETLTWGVGESTHSTQLHWNGGNLMVDAQVDARGPFPFLFDSGAGGNLVCLATAEKLGKSAQGPAQQSAVAGGTVPVFSGFDGTLGLADDRPLSTKFTLQPCPVTAEPGQWIKAGYVGVPWFTGRRVFVPADRKSIRFTAATESTASR